MAFDNAALVRRIFDELWTRGLLGVADEVATSSTVHHDPIMGDITGPDAMKAIVQGYRAAFPDLRFVIDDLRVAGDTVIVRWTAIGTHKGTLFGIAPTGKQVTTQGINCERCQNGKVVESWVQWDQLKLLQTIGAVPPLGIGTTKPTQPEARPH
jgi:predicted ester cyclase